MDCPKCKNTTKTEGRITRGKQRYKCTSCNYRYTESDVKSEAVRRLTLNMYLESLGFRSIEDNT